MKTQMRRGMLVRLMLVTALVCCSIQSSQAQTSLHESDAAQTSPEYSYLEALGLGWLEAYFSTPESQTASSVETGCPPCNIDPD